MKKSNSLFISVFIFMILLIITIHIALFATAKTGNIIISNTEVGMPTKSGQAFPQILLVPFNILPGAS